jgi:threonine dehydrogenase-like Zn-dependent dehydrogenase
MPKTMRAARIQPEITGGSRHVFRVEELPVPDVTNGEVLVRVLRAGLNRGDVDLRDEVVELAQRGGSAAVLPITVGHDGMGQVAEVGPNVETVRVGDRVVVIAALTCGSCKYCRTDRDHICAYKRTMGFPTRLREWPERLARYKEGLWAEYCRVPASHVVRLPADTEVDEACKVSQIAVGYRALKRARLRPGETVVVNGASGIAGMGAGLSALAMGAGQVIAIARNAARIERVQRIDPNRVTAVALGRGDSIADAVTQRTDGQGGSVLADFTPYGSNDTTIACIRTLERGGRVLLAGSYTDEPFALSLDYIMLRSLEILGVTGRSPMDVAEVLELVRAGLIDTRHITTRYFSLAAADDALDFIEERGDGDPIWPMYAPEAS